MQYIDYLTKQPSDKDAIITNGDCDTYGKLYALVKDAREHLPQITEKHLISGVCGNESGTGHRAGGQQTRSDRSAV